MQELAARGLTLKEEIKRSSRFVSCVAETRDQKLYFAKIVTPGNSPEVMQELYDRLQMEYLFYARCGNRRGLPFVVPKLYGLEPFGYISAYLRGKPLGGRGHATTERLLPFIPALVDITLSVATDIETLAPPRTGLAWREKIESAPWINKAREILDPDQYQKALRIIARQEKRLPLGPTHGDLWWENMLLVDSGDIAVLDAEKWSVDARPRLYDVAYLYTRLVTVTKSFDIGNQYLRRVYDRLGLPKDAFIQEFLPVLLERCVGVHADAVNDLAHAAGPRDYRDMAKELLRVSLKRQVFESL